MRADIEKYIPNIKICHPWQHITLLRLVTHGKSLAEITNQQAASIEFINHNLSEISKIVFSSKLSPSRITTYCPLVFPFQLLELERLIQ